MWSKAWSSRSLTAAALVGDPVDVVARDVRLAAVAGADGVARRESPPWSLMVRSMSA